MKYFSLFLFPFFTMPLFGQLTVVVLGSSTAAGTGSSHPDSSWVGRYQNFLQAENSDNEVVNLAQGGYTTFHILPTGTVTPANRPNPDNAKNISAALSFDPDAIIINLPSNDAANGFPIGEQLANYNAVFAEAVSKDIPVWVATTQGRNLNPEGRQNLIEMRDSTYARYGDMAIDFWTYIGQSNGTLNVIYDSGDGIHLNDKGHKLLFDRVVEKNIPDAVLTDLDFMEKEKRAWKVYPNPVEERLYISFESQAHDKVEVRLIDVWGKHLASYLIEKNHSDLEINVGSLQKGAYYLIFLNGENTWGETFIKSK